MAFGQELKPETVKSLVKKRVDFFLDQGSFSQFFSNSRGVLREILWLIVRLFDQRLFLCGACI